MKEFSLKRYAVVKLSYLHDGNSYAGNMESLYWNIPPNVESSTAMVLTAWNADIPVFIGWISHRSGTFQRGAMMWDANRFVSFRRQIQHTKNDYLYDIIKQYQHQILILISWSGQLGINAMSPWPRGNMDIACIRKRKCLGMLAFDWKLIKFWRGRWKLRCSGVVTHWRALRNQF